MASKEPKEGRFNVRVPGDLVRRMDALLPKARAIPECALLGSIRQSAILRVALLRGIAVLEDEVRRAHGKRGSDA